MENKSPYLAIPSMPPSSPSAEQANPPVQAKKRFGKKLYVTIAAIIVIIVIVSAVLLVAPSNAEVISLGVHYSVGEKLTYDVTTSTSSEIGNSSSNLSAQSTLTVDVLSFDGNVYTINYTTTSALGGYSMTTSHLLEVQQSDMVNLLTLLPVALQQYTNDNSTSPVETAIFNQTQAKVGDTWQIPLDTPASTSAPASELTVTFAVIQDLTVKAGTYKVFKIDFSAQTNTQENQNTFLGQNFDVSGQSYLEFGTCKQIQSTLLLNMTSSTGNILGTNLAISFTSTLTQDLNP